MYWSFNWFLLPPGAAGELQVQGEGLSYSYWLLIKESEIEYAGHQIQIKNYILRAIIVLDGEKVLGTRCPTSNRHFTIHRLILSSEEELEIYIGTDEEKDWIMKVSSGDKMIFSSTLKTETESESIQVGEDKELDLQSVTDNLDLEPKDG